MVNSCCVCGIESSSVYGDRSFHKFPKLEEIRNKWINAIGKTISFNHAFICSEHFHPKDFINFFAKRRMLQRDSVPSLNLSKSVKIKQEEIQAPGEMLNESVVEQSCSDDNNYSSISNHDEASTSEFCNTSQIKIEPLPEFINPSQVKIEPEALLEVILNENADSDPLINNDEPSEDDDNLSTNDRKRPLDPNDDFTNRKKMKISLEGTSIWLKEEDLIDKQKWPVLVNFVRAKNEAIKSLKRSNNYVKDSEDAEPTKFSFQDSEDTDHRIRGRCKICSRTSDRKSKLKCCKCKRFVCKEHSNIFKTIVCYTCGLCDVN
ncbi:uncharacterized protein LOC114344050 isoform X2 [Diabrotica virgifera virgifera]|uniref:Uncharacterized protein LOC114344050 isoform X2 n=1 Tax=Diabrotica virgifera virgifera TaxID=50390 RepID=A0A6P7GZ50_DIAVI|nr:uncharacterized protein LOC114344050 isoform X2 [Diabrotica virgifera virgifera]